MKVWNVINDPKVISVTVLLVLFVFVLLLVVFVELSTWHDSPFEPTTNPMGQELKHRPLNRIGEAETHTVQLDKLAHPEQVEGHARHWLLVVFRKVPEGQEVKQFA